MFDVFSVERKYNIEVNTGNIVFSVDIDDDGDDDNDDDDDDDDDVSYSCSFWLIFQWLIEWITYLVVTSIPHLPFWLFFC